MGSYTHSIRVRYGECDMQGVVFNGNYLAYVDDAVDRWMRTSLATAIGRDRESHFNLHEIGFDFMVKSVSLIFEKAATYGDTLDIECVVSRWGNTSFDVSAVGSVGSEKRFTAALTYVSVLPVQNTPIATPQIVRDALDSSF